jgi:hypothetical protein
MTVLSSVKGKELSDGERLYIYDGADRDQYGMLPYEALRGSGYPTPKPHA